MTDDGKDVAAIPQAAGNGQAAYNYFVSQGLAPHQAAGIVGNLQGESGQGLDPTAVSPGDGRDGSDSIGIGQWNGGRAQALKAYAAAKGTSWDDLNTQLEFLHSELKGPESAAYGKLLAAQTPEQAGQAMLAFERPKDWDRPGAHPERARYAARAYAAYGNGDPSIMPAPTSRSAPAAAAPASPPPISSQLPIFAGEPMPAMAAPQMAPALAQAAPVFFPQQKPIDLSGLKEALAARAPIFANLGNLSNG